MKDILTSKISNVTHYILNKTGKITSFKLQRLVYYSYVWNLIWTDEKLFDNEIYSWNNSPVVEDLYNLHKGKFYITKEDFTSNNIATLTDEEKQNINEVLKAYSHLTGDQLSNLTHEEDPCKNTESNKVIQDCDIFEYYQTLKNKG